MRPPADLAAVRARIEAACLDDADDPVPFSGRLRRETGWSAVRTARAIAEYKRFLILAMVAGHPVSPSPAVDAVWHLHLTDSRRYWEDFCPNILGRPLHHDPSRGGAAERARHDDQYRRTLATYARVFGEAPARDIWPRTAAAAAAPARQALAALYHALGSGPRTLAIAAGASAAGLLVAGCAAIYDSSSPGAIQGPTFIAIYAPVAVAAVFVTLALQGALAPKTAPASVSPAMLGAYELAYLAGGPQRVLWTVILRLRQGGFLLRDPAKGRQRLQVGAPLPADAAPVEIGVVNAVAADRLRNPSAISQEIAQLKDKLMAAGLVSANQGQRRGPLAPAMVFGPLMLLGAVRLYYGHLGQRPTKFLVFALIFQGLAVLILSLRPLGSPQAKAAIKGARAVHPRRRVREDDSQMARMVALYGLMALAGGAFADTRPVLMQLAPQGGGDSSGSGCGGDGGGCGGGCGGCGG